MPVRRRVSLSEATGQASALACPVSSEPTAEEQAWPGRVQCAAVRHRLVEASHQAHGLRSGTVEFRDAQNAARII